MFVKVEYNKEIKEYHCRKFTIISNHIILDRLVINLSNVLKVMINDESE